MLESGVLSGRLGFTKFAVQSVGGISEEKLDTLEASTKGSMEQRRRLEACGLDNHVPTSGSPIISGFGQYHSRRSMNL